MLSLNRSILYCNQEHLRMWLLILQSPQAKTTRLSKRKQVLNIHASINVSGRGVLMLCHARSLQLSKRLAVACLT